MIRSLEGMRGIAALIVALYHLGIGAQHWSVIRNGYLFVDLFFVLSGFIMCAAYGTRLANGDDLKVFLVRRFGRLFPLLIFSTLAYLAIANFLVLAKRLALTHGYSGLVSNPDALEWVVPNVSEILATLTMTHSLGVFDRLILNTPSWSISVEFYAYVLFAMLCLVLAGKTRLIAFGLVSVVAFVVTVWASVSVHDCLTQKGCLSVTYDFGFPRALFSFFMGALLYALGRRWQGSYLGMQLAALGMLALAFALVDSVPALAFVLPSVFALLILSVCADVGPLAHVLKPRFFQLLGLWSYSIYLMHMPLMLVFENFSRRVDSAAGALLVLFAYVLAVLVVSAWTYRYIEDPMRAWFNRLAARRTLAAGSTG